MKGRFRIFKDRDGRKVILFPFAKTFVETDDAGIDALRSWDRGCLAISGCRFLEDLEQRGLIGEDTEPADQPANRPYMPTAVTLLPTLDCNLRCRYCYSSGGERKTQMPPEIGKAAINFIAANAITAGSKTIRLTFHGGGEPTVHWDFLTAMTGYARSIAKVLDLRCSVHVGTNGVLDGGQIDWLTEHLDSATVSIDGPVDVHDEQRPTAQGTGSFEFTMNTLEEFERRGFPFQLRTTVTAKLLPRLRDFVETMARHTPSVRVHQLEPMFPSGRGNALDSLVPPTQAFTDAYRSIAAWTAESRYPVSISSCDVGSAREYYCGAYGDNFVVAPDGSVTTCYEVSSPSDAHWDLFNIGFYEQDKGKFRIFDERIQKLRELGSNEIADCGDCFARFTCGGDCPVKRITLRTQSGSNQRCNVIKTLTLEGIRDKLERTMPDMDVGALPENS